MFARIFRKGHNIQVSNHIVQHPQKLKVLWLRIRKLQKGSLACWMEPKSWWNMQEYERSHPDIRWYCWWKKSCTTWDVQNPINNGINYLSTGAGFFPSTVLVYESMNAYDLGSRVASIYSVDGYHANPPLGGVGCSRWWKESTKEKTYCAMMGVFYSNPCIPTFLHKERQNSEFHQHHVVVLQGYLRSVAVFCTSTLSGLFFGPFVWAPNMQTTATATTVTHEHVG